MSKKGIGCGTWLNNCGPTLTISEQCRRISLELAATAEALADQWDAIDLTIVEYLGNQAAGS